MSEKKEKGLNVCCGEPVVMIPILDYYIAQYEKELAQKGNETAKEDAVSGETIQASQEDED